MALSMILFWVFMVSGLAVALRPVFSFVRKATEDEPPAQLGRRDAHALGLPWIEDDGSLSWPAELSGDRPYVAGGITTEAAGRNLAASLGRALRPGETIAPTMDLAQYLSYVRHNVANTTPPTNTVVGSVFTQSDDVQWVGVDDEVEPQALPTTQVNNGPTYVYLARHGTHTAFELPSGWTAADWRMAASLVFTDNTTPDEYAIGLPSGVVASYGEVRSLVKRTRF